MGATAQCGADVGCERSDVGARRAASPSSAKTSGVLGGSMSSEWIVTGRGAARPPCPRERARGGACRRPSPPTPSGGICSMASDEAARPWLAPRRGRRTGHVVGGGDVALGVERRRLDAEPDGRGHVGLRQLGDEAQETSTPADAQDEDPGGRWVERARVADLAGSQDPLRALATTSWLVQPASLSTTAKPSGPPARRLFTRSRRFGGSLVGARAAPESRSSPDELRQDLLDASAALRWRDR